MRVSLTSFLDYIAASGTTRLVRVRDAKNQYEQGYAPERDFYGPLRKRIVQTFEEGWNSARLDELLAEVDDPKKQQHYAACRKGIRKWAGVSGKKSYEWAEPKRAIWKTGDLEVNVSPELWVAVDSEPEIVKLYFKADPLSQQRVTLALYLLEKTVGKHGAVGILDLQQGKLFRRTKQPPEGVDLLLASEAAGFVTLWDSLP
jgi:hypothetical protein